MTPEQMAALAKLQKAYAEALAEIDDPGGEFADQMVLWQEETSHENLIDRLDDLEDPDADEEE